MNIISLLFFLLVMVFTGCKKLIDKDSVNIPICESPQKFYAMNNGSSGFRMVYSSDGRIESFYRGFDEDFSIQKDVITDDQGFIRQILEPNIDGSEGIDTLDVIYNDDLVIGISFYDYWGGTHLYEYSYDNSNRIISLDINNSNTNNTVYRYTYTYTFDNVTRMDYYQINDGVSSHLYKFLYTYDNQPNPYNEIDEKYHSFLLGWQSIFPLSSNNVTQVDVFGPNNFLESKFYQYSYRADGYPESGFEVPDIYDYGISYFYQ